jgi:alkylation response protein AidB-like acyl-CoA dehydrogenase
MPHGGLATSAFACVAVGIAEGFLADYIALTKQRVSRGMKVAEQTGTQISLAVAAAEIEAAAALYMAPAAFLCRRLARAVRRQCAATRLSRSSRHGDPYRPCLGRRHERIRPAYVGIGIGRHHADHFL